MANNDYLTGLRFKSVMFSLLISLTQTYCDEKLNCTYIGPKLVCFALFSYVD